MEKVATTTTTTTTHNNSSHYHQQSMAAEMTDEMVTLEQQSKDEVDFVVVSHNNNNYDDKFTKTTTAPATKATTRTNKNSENVPKITKDSKQETDQETQKQSQVPIKDSSKTKRKIDENVEQKKSTPRTPIKEKHSLFHSFGKKFSHKHVSAAAGIKELNAEKDEQHEKISTSTATENTESTSKTFPVPKEPAIPIGTPPRQHKFTKSSSIARLLGNTYNAKKFEKQEQKRQANDGKFNTFGGRRRLSGPYLERFKRCSKDDDNVSDHVIGNGTMALITDSREFDGGSRNELIGLKEFEIRREIEEDLGIKAFRTISRGLGKLWWKRSHSVDISAPDPEFKVSYLGNVLTGWAKGEGCVEKQLNTLWRNYTQNNKPDVVMRLSVCASGLKATTRQHGLTEYWANRITHCCAPKNYPRVFCWIYRHEGRKLKHELRCHAVLCAKEKIVQDICNTLKENLESALREFKREKILKQNARLSLANAADDNPSLPRRKIMLSVGGNNYRPPLERSKSAPKLMAIEEAIGEEGEEMEETNEPEMKSCCQKDSLYPAMTLGRRHCRRGHSIRRTGKTRPDFSQYLAKANADLHTHMNGCCQAAPTATGPAAATATATANTKDALVEPNHECEARNSFGSDDSDEFEKLLKYNNYDLNGSLTNELLPYFEMQLHKKTSCSLGSLSELKDDEEPLSLTPTINSDPSAAPIDDVHIDDDMEHQVIGLRRNDVCSDGEEDYLEADDLYFRQAAILNMLHRNSMRKMANLSLSSDESSIETNASASLEYRHQPQSSISSNASTTTSVSALEGLQNVNTNEQRKQMNLDSDEGSISSGCETASTVTANQDDISLNYRQNMQQFNQVTASMADTQQLQEYGLLDEEPITADEIYQRLESRLQKRQNSDATTFSSSSSITLKMGNSPATSIGGGLDADVNNVNNLNTNTTTAASRSRRARRQAAAQREQQCAVDSDSECSDESGYVEFLERDKIKNAMQIATQQQLKPQVPPKPMPRRLLSANNTTTAV